MKRFQPHHTDLSDKQRMRRVIASPLTFIVIVGLAGIVGWNTWDMYTKWRTSNDALAEARIAYSELQEREAFLNQQIGVLETDAGVEAEVRDRFGVAKEGEKVIVILDEEEQNEIVEEDGGFWSRVKGWFTRD